MFYVYILRSAVTSRFYIGSTQDLQTRLLQHNAGASKATRHGVPWTLVHTEALPSRAEAVRKEKYYKTGRGRDELQAILAATSDRTHRAALD